MANNHLIDDSAVSIQDLYPKGSSGQVLQMSGTTVVWGAGGSGSAITVKDEGSTLTTALSSLDFVGAGVTATTVGNDVTVTIPGGSGSSNTGTAQVDFGSSVRVNEVSIAVTGQTSIGSTSRIKTWIQESSTSDNSAANHRQAAAFMKTVAGSIVAGTGFTITAYCLIGSATGKFNIQWEWI